MPDSYKVDIIQVGAFKYTRDSLQNKRMAKCNTKSKGSRWNHDHYNPSFKLKTRLKRSIELAAGRKLLIMTPEEVLKKINELGGNIKSDSTIRKYAALKLIPKPTHKSAGKGHGSTSEYHNDTPAEFRASQIMRKGSIIKIQPEYLSQIRKAALSIEKNISLVEARTRKGLIVKDEEGKEVNINENYETEEVKFTTDKGTYDFLMGSGSYGTIRFEEAGEANCIPNKILTNNAETFFSVNWLHNKLKGLAGFNPTNEKVGVYYNKINSQEEGGAEEYIISVVNRK